ncbi:MAG: SDR family NAD(P)-dependent oxidoreductase, partial [Pseudomonadota bacterium]
MRAPWPPAHALISGGSSGIGLAIAQQLAAAGSRVSLIARREGPLRAAAQALGPAAQVFPADLTDAEAAARAA